MDWPIVAARRRDPSLVGVPVVVVDRAARGVVVRTASKEARAEGVTVGLRRREAEARCAGLVVLEAEDSADARAFETVVRAVEQLVPRLVLECPGALLFPTRGPSRYFGGDDALGARIVARARDIGVEDVHVGIADGAFAAALAARAAAERALDVLVVAPGAVDEFLAPWPITVVGPSVDAVHGDGDGLVDLLARLGLRTLGAFAELPEPAVLARFGRPGVRAHRLARGIAEHDPEATAPPPEWAETIEFDPPATRVDEAMFAAKMLADRLMARLEARGLSCTRVAVEAETEHGERLTRCWRHEGVLTPATLTTRVRWQLEAWLTAEVRAGQGAAPADFAAPDVDAVTAGLTLLRIAPDDMGPATGRQLGFWGGDPAAEDRAARTLARVQGMLGHEAVVTAVPTGGRTPAERIGLIPWGDARDDARSDTPRTGPAPWPGAVPGPAPARVFDPPLAADFLDADGTPVTVSGRGEASASPASLWCDALPGGGGEVVAWSGPWAHDVRWWSHALPADRGRRRRALWQVVAVSDAITAEGPDHAADHAGDHAAGHADTNAAGVACLVVLERGRAGVEAIYD